VPTGVTTVKDRTQTRQKIKREVFRLKEQSVVPHHQHVVIINAYDRPKCYLFQQSCLNLKCLFGHPFTSPQRYFMIHLKNIRSAHDRKVTCLMSFTTNTVGVAMISPSDIISLRSHILQRQAVAGSYTQSYNGQISTPDRIPVSVLYSNMPHR
jgi:hypothetical protein